MIATRRGSWAPPRPWVWLSLAPFVLWPGYWLLHGDSRWELAAIMLLVLVLALGPPAFRKLYTGLYPVGVVGLVYDAMRFLKHSGVAERVHVCDLRAIDAQLFGVMVNGQRTTVHDLLQAHANVVLDLICAFPYATYIFAALGTAIYLYRHDFTALRRFTWTFLVVNLAGFITYQIYPAAPPWYFHAHGCAVDIHTAASTGPNLARVDALLGIHYFAGFYGRSNDVFGAVPSLHVSYPLLILLEGYRHFNRPLRAAAVAFFVTMCFAAVYLDHHWVVDVVLGLGYTLASNAAVRAAFRRFVPGLAASPEIATVPEPEPSPVLVTTSPAKAAQVAVSAGER